MTFLTFWKAAWALKQQTISAEEYFHIILTRVGNNQPDEDSTNDDLVALRLVDSFAAYNKSLLLEHYGAKFVTTHQSDLQQYLVSCWNGSLKQTTTVLERLVTTDPQSNRRLLYQPAAIIAGKQGHADILSWAIAKGVALDMFVDKAVFEGLTPDTLKVLYDAGWRNVNTSQSALNDLLVDCEAKGVPIVKLLLDLKAEIVSEVFNRAALLPSSGADLDTWRLLIRHGREALRESNALEIAATRERYDVIKLIVEALEIAYPG